MSAHIPIEQSQARFLKCIGEHTRLKILKLLVDGDRCVGEIVRGTSREQSLISHHLRVLKDCNIVISRQEAQKVYYRLADPRLAELVLKSESLVKELPLCQTKEARGEGKEDSECGEAKY